MVWRVVVWEGDERMRGSIPTVMHQHCTSTAPYLPKSPWPYCTSLVVAFDPFAIERGISISNLTQAERLNVRQRM
jgi:hypothetical protein